MYLNYTWYTNRNTANSAHRNNNVPKEFMNKREE